MDALHRLFTKGRRGSRRHRSAGALIARVAVLAALGVAAGCSTTRQDVVQPPVAKAPLGATYYASPDGTGDGLSVKTSFKIADFWPLAKPGDTLLLLDGTYRGANWVPQTFAGTPAQPITIKALNDGKVLLDGGNHRSMDLRGSYGVLEGVNICGGDNGTLSFRGDHWTARRVVAWRNDLNSDGIVTFAGHHNTWEDGAAFGSCRVTVTIGAGSDAETYNTMRRCWVRWEQRSQGGSPSTPIVVGYGGQSRVTLENVLATRDVVGYQSAPEPPMQLSSTSHSSLLGCISYAPAGARFDCGQLLVSYGGGTYREVDDKHFPPTAHNTVRDTVAIADPKSDSFNAKAFDWFALPGTDNTLINVVGVSGRKGGCDTVGWSGWDKVRWGTTIAEAIGPGKSMFDEVPGIGYRYINGTLTNEPLWPWPMNQRIKDALVLSGWAPVDITATMEELFGKIPGKYRSDK